MRANLFRSMVACSIAMVISTSAAAALVDYGSETYDSDTNLLWLDLTQTEGLSPLAALTLFPLYRYARQSEVYTFFIDGGITAVDNTDRTADYFDAVLLSNLLGVTFGSGSVFGSQGLAERTASPGFFIDPFVSSNSSLATGKAYPGVTSFSANVALGDVGVFLVRELPEPSTLALLGLGLAGLAGARVHRGRSGNGLRRT